MPNRIKFTIRKFEKAYSEYLVKDQIDFCNSKKYKDTVVADFFISSSYNPVAIGYLKYDYVSKNMIETTIVYGARYIELEILDFEIKNKTVPVIGLANKEGHITNSQNVLTCDEVFSTIKEVAFSQRYIDNYKDPFFIFLNIKTKNTNTLDQLYLIIQKYLHNRLIEKEYLEQQINIATTNVCNLLSKIVILSSDGYQHSKLESIINLSTNNSYLRRIKWDDLPHSEELLSENDKPEVEFVSNKVAFQNKYLVFEDKNINLLGMGITSNNLINISGAINHKNNNSGEHLLQIKSVTRNTLIFEDDHKFEEEEIGNNIHIKIYPLSHMLKNLDKQNKQSLTIVYTGEEFSSENFDPKTAWNLGCQFVCMNFQNVDKNLTKYMDKFKNLSFKLKSSNLRNAPIPIVKSTMNQEYPSFMLEDNIPVIQNFTKKYDSLDSVYISPFNNDELKVINDNGNSKLSLEESSKSKLIIKDRNDKLYNTISIQSSDLSKELFLTSNQPSCYLSFQTNTNSKQNDLSKNNMFYPVKALNGNEDYVSFLQKVDNKNFYLKYRESFSSDNRLYHKTNPIKLSGSIISDNGTRYEIYECILTDDYKSIGSIVHKVNGASCSEITKEETITPETEPPQTNISTTPMPIKSSTELFQESFQDFENTPPSNSIVLNGAVSEPIDFKEIWMKNGSYLWQPIAADGFVALGVVFTTTSDKPIRENYCCVARNFLKEAKYKLNPDMCYNLDTNNPLTLWSANDVSKSHKYHRAIIGNARPSKFLNPIYDLNFESNNTLEYLYIGKVELGDEDSATFKINKVDSSEKEAVTVIPPIKFVESFNYKIKLNNDSCIGLKNSYWSLENNTLRYPELSLSDCKDNTYWPNNFVENNGKLYLKNFPNKCLTNSNNELVLSNCDSNNPNQNFIISNNKIETRTTNGTSTKCLEYQNNKFIFKECNNENQNQIWKMNNVNTHCLRKNTVILYKTTYARAKEETNRYSNKKNNSYIYNYLSEVIDDEFFHLYLKGKITDVNKNIFTITLNNNLGQRNVNVNDNSLIPLIYNNSSNIKEGMEVLLTDGIFTVEDYNKTNVFWKAKVIQKLENNKCEVIFSINSIEANENKYNMGRPRTNNKKIVDMDRLVILNPGLNCEL
jgi:hypothetical protein